MNSTILLVRKGEKFSKRYVELFERFNPVTLTDQPDTPGRTRALRTENKGYASKMELFAPWNEDLRPAVYFDLDTYILGDISDLLSFEIKNLWMIREFNPEIRRSESGIMMIPKDTDEIWKKFLKTTVTDHFLDGVFLNQFPHKILNDQFDGIVSYKLHCHEGPTGRIIAFHGRPKPHECEGWAGQIFKGELQ